MAETTDRNGVAIGCLEQNTQRGHPMRPDADASMFPSPDLEPLMVRYQQADSEAVMILIERLSLQLYVSVRESPKGCWARPADLGM